MFVEVANAAGADCVVTGNRRHFPAEQVGDVRVLVAREFGEHGRSRGRPASD